jgi:hypothetical protein
VIPLKRRSARALPARHRTPTHWEGCPSAKAGGAFECGLEHRQSAIQGLTWIVLTVVHADTKRSGG